MFRMNSNERRAHSLESKRQHALEHPTTSSYAAMFAAPRVDQPISDETGVHSDEDIRALNDTNARDPGIIGHSPMNPDDDHADVLEEAGLGAVGEVQQARISNDGLYPDSERHKAEKYRQC